MLHGLLDYDGYICKAFYASVAREENEIEDMMNVLDELTKSAQYKLDQIDKNNRLIKVVSGHTYKKDIYPSYKSKRKRNEDLGMFREYVLTEMSDTLIKIPQLEADDVLIMMYEELDNAIVFSDDKDLRYYCPNYCKINLTEEISEQKDYIKKQLEQMLIGDKEDCIDGIPKVGEKTAEKLLDMYGYNLKSVVEVYRDKNISVDECLKNLVLVTPVCKDLVKDYKYGFDDSSTMNNILGHFRFFNELVMEVYNEK